MVEITYANSHVVWTFHLVAYIMSTFVAAFCFIYSHWLRIKAAKSRGFAREDMENILLPVFNDLIFGQGLLFLIATAIYSVILLTCDGKFDLTDSSCVVLVIRCETYFICEVHATLTFDVLLSLSLCSLSLYLSLSLS